MGHANNSPRSCVRLLNILSSHSLLQKCPNGRLAPSKSIYQISPCNSALNTLKAKGEELKEGKEECSTKIHNRFMPFCALFFRLVFLQA